METTPIDEHDAREALVSFGRLRRRRDAAERDIFLLAAHFADLYDADATLTDRHLLPGMEMSVRLAGAGTPAVREFAVAEMAGELGIGTGSAKRLLGDVLETRHRLPRLWARVAAGEVQPWVARKVAQATRALSLEQAAYVDAGVAEYADGRLPFHRFLTVVEAKVVEADPEAAAERELAAAQEQFAKVGRSNDHGQKTLYVKDHAAAITRIDATIAYLADGLRALGDADPEDARRAKAMLLMANPLQALQLLQAYAAHVGRSAGTPTPSDGYAPEDEPLSDDDPADDTSDEGSVGATADGEVAQGSGLAAFARPFHPADVPAAGSTGWTFDPRSLLPTVTLYLHLHADSLDGSGGVVRWEGEGPVSAQYVRDFLGPHCRFTVRPVVDLAGQAPVDAYEIPDRLREAVQLRTPADVFPYAGSTRRGMDLDHTRRYVPPDEGGPPGQTREDNLAPMSRFHHRVKTHGDWELQQPFPGIFVWRAPHGAIYLVDHTGTRQVRGTPDVHGPGSPQPVTRLERYVADLVVEYAA